MPLNILVVDDSAVMRSIVIRTLTMSGLDVGEVYQAGDGAEGLEALHQHNVDIAFIDINMPVMTGLEMIEEVRRSPQWADLPIVVVSTEGSDTRIEHIEHEWGAKFIHKPFTPERVRDVVLDITGVIND
jgi:two-component system chemotaxis response regulator CheY